MNWINVKDRLPGIGERVLVDDAGYGIQIGWLTVTKKWQLAYQMPTFGEINHWMPLPEQPQNEQK